MTTDGNRISLQNAIGAIGERDAGTSQVSIPLPPKPRSSIRWYQWPILLSVDMIGPFSTDAYIPNIPSMRRSLSCPITMATLTLQINWVANSVANSACGSLSDRFGRRNVLLCSMVLYVCGSGVCAVAPNVVVLILGRTLQGLGQGASVLPSAIARDLIDDVGERTRAMALLGSLRPIIIITAPTIGGSLGHFLGWRFIFKILVVWGAGTAALAFFFLPETNDATLLMRASIARASEMRGGASHAPEPEPTPPALDTATILRRLFSSRLYVGFLGLIGLFFAGVAAMLTLLPFVLEHYYGLSELVTGLLMGAIPVCGMLGGSLSMVLAARVQPFTVARIAMIPYACATLISLYLALNFKNLDAYGIGESDWWPTLVPCLLMIGFQFMVEPVARSLYLHDFKEVAGSAEGFCGLAQVLAMALGSAAASACYTGTPKYFYYALALCTATAQIWFWIVLGLLPPTGAFIDCRKSAAVGDEAVYSALSSGADETDDETKEGRGI